MLTEITWSSGSSPAAYCAGLGTNASDIVYGYPTTWRCRYADGTAGASVFSATPSCADGSQVDFVQQLCVVSSDAQVFDYGYASALWGFSFSMVVGLFVVARYGGVILEFIRRG